MMCNRRAGRRDAGDLLLGLLDLCNDALGAGEKHFALGGERQTAGAALEQAGAQAVLQPRHELGDGRRGQT